MDDRYIGGYGMDKLLDCGQSKWMNTWIDEWMIG